MKLSDPRGESPLRAGVPAASTGQAVPGSEESGMVANHKVRTKVIHC
jgi:hypothetical protein